MEEVQTKNCPRSGIVWYIKYSPTYKTLENQNWGNNHIYKHTDTQAHTYTGFALVAFYR